LTGDSVSLSVKRGALIAARDAMTLVYEPRAVKPSAIVMTGWGGVITLAALRFCAKHKIAVVILDWDRDFMTAMAWADFVSARDQRSRDFEKCLIFTGGPAESAAVKETRRSMGGPTPGRSSSTTLQSSASASISSDAGISLV
jgi:hypothetical protein